MMGQIYREQENPPHFYLFSSQSSAVGLRNALRPEDFANNCIEWALRMFIYAGQCFSSKKDKSFLSFVNTTDFVGDEPMNISPPSTPELCEFTRAGNIEAVNAYCKNFDKDEINAYVPAKKIASGFVEKSLGEFTALHLACIYEQRAVAMWLLEHGANPQVAAQPSSHEIDAWLLENDPLSQVDKKFMNVFDKLGNEKRDKAKAFLCTLLVDFKKEKSDTIKTAPTSPVENQNGKQENRGFFGMRK